jgi:hypothetical protein
MTGGPEYVQHSEPILSTGHSLPMVILRSSLAPVSDASKPRPDRIVDRSDGRALRIELHEVEGEAHAKYSNKKG